MPTNQPILIAVLGVTGAGKSTFINKATDSNLAVGESIRSCTQTIGSADVKIDGRTVRLIDTPGFDDYIRTDADILKNIGEWLAATYDNNILLTGIILLQPVTGARFTGAEASRTRLFKNICGPNAFSNVVIASTMWSELRDQTLGAKRVNERTTDNDFWGDMIQHGARVAMHSNDKASAHSIIRILLDKQKKALQMQTELARSDGVLLETSAGRQLHYDLGVASQEQTRKLSELMEDLHKSRASQQDSQKELKQLRDRLESLESQKTQLENAKPFKVSPKEHSSNSAWVTAFGTVASAGAASVAAAAAVAPFFCSVM